MSFVLTFGLVVIHGKPVLENAGDGAQMQFKVMALLPVTFGQREASSKTVIRFDDPPSLVSVEVPDALLHTPVTRHYASS